MNSKGIVRKLDKLGRITLPKELCKKLNISRGKTFVEFFTEGDFVILRKEEPPACIFCMAEIDIAIYSDKCICKSCIRKINEMSSQK